MGYLEHLMREFFQGQDAAFEYVCQDELGKHGIKLEDEIFRLELPVRKTAKSAGYDFMVPVDFIVPAGEIKYVPTGVKASFPDFMVLYLYLRSSSPKKLNIRMANSVACIDADYYGNPDNDGHMFFAIENKNDFDLILKRGDYIGQGVFSPFFTTKNDAAAGERVGGFGSTSK